MKKMLIGLVLIFSLLLIGCNDKLSENEQLIEDIDRWFIDEDLFVDDNSTSLIFNDSELYYINNSPIITSNIFQIQDNDLSYLQLAGNMSESFDNCFSIRSNESIILRIDCNGTIFLREEEIGQDTKLGILLSEWW